MVAPGIRKLEFSSLTDLANHAIEYIANQHMIAPDLPFFMYSLRILYAPHHAPKEWIEKQKGKFDKGWDVIRDEILERQKDMGIMRPDTELAPTLAGMNAPFPIGIPSRLSRKHSTVVLWKFSRATFPTLTVKSVALLISWRIMTCWIIHSSSSFQTMAPVEREGQLVPSMKTSGSITFRMT